MEEKVGEIMHPLFLVIFSLFILGLVINNCIVNRKVSFRKITYSCVNVFAWAIICIFYDKYIYDTMFELYIYGYAVLTFLVFGILLYFSFKSSMLRAHHYQLFIDSIKNTRFNVYYVVDEKERIKDMSQSLLEELGLEFHEVNGKKLFDIFDKTIRFTKFNDVDVNNKTVREFYKPYKSQAREGVNEKREMVIQNYDGKSIVLNVVEQPVFIFKKYKGRMVIGEKKSDLTLLNAEKELKDSIAELNSIRHKFIATLEITEECIFYIDLDQKYVWGTNNFKDTLGLPGNTLGIDDYRDYIHQDDQIKYLKTMESLTKNNPNYSISYRFRIGDKFIWIKETGKRIFDDENSNVILGFVKKNETSGYEKMGTRELDGVGTEIELLTDVTRLYNDHRTFELLAIRLNNIPEVNEKYGRSVGNMMLNEYVRRIKQNFKTESSDIYRIGGIEFILTITDARKMEMLKKLFQVEKAPLNLNMEYGGISVSMDVRAGIAISSTDASEANALIGCARYALKFATDENYAKNCCYFRDVK